MYIKRTYSRSRAIPIQVHTCCGYARGSCDRVTYLCSNATNKLQTRLRDWAALARNSRLEGLGVGLGVLGVDEFDNEVRGCLGRRECTPCAACHSSQHCRPRPVSQHRKTFFSPPTIAEQPGQNHALLNCSLCSLRLHCRQRRR